MSNIFNDNLDIFDLIRLPLLIQLIHTSPVGSSDIYILMEIMNALIFCIDEDDAVKSAYFSDLIHYNCIYKKHFSHHFVMGALTTLLASTASYADEINYEPLKQVFRLLKNLLLSPEAEVLNGNGNLIQKLSYGRREHVISSMFKSKMSDMLFSLASSVNDDIFQISNSDVSSIFEDIFCIVASLFENIDLSQLFIQSQSNKTNNLDLQQTKKPIRHGRFSGSVSIQLSVK